MGMGWLRTTRKQARIVRQSLEPRRKFAARTSAARTQLAQGTLGAVAPADTDEQRLLSFHDGGLLPADPAQHVPGGWIQAVPDTIPEIAAIVAKRTSKLRNPLLWVHEPQLSEDDLAREGLDPRRLSGQLYCVCDGDIRSASRIADIIGFFLLSWHFLAFVTDGVHEATAVADLLANAELILVGAYDGESALVWERSA